MKSPNVMINETRFCWRFCAVVSDNYFIWSSLVHVYKGSKYATVKDSWSLLWWEGRMAATDKEQWKNKDTAAVAGDVTQSGDTWSVLLRCNWLSFSLV